MKYPIFLKDQAWKVVSSMLVQDSVLPGFRKCISGYKKDFFEIYDVIKDENGHVVSTRYRSARNKGFVNPLHMGHFVRLLYFFSHRLFIKKADPMVLDQMFFSMRMRAQADFFYEFELKEYFLPVHPLATVITKAKYGKYFVISQYCTVGTSKGLGPSFGDRVIMRPGSMVIGNCNIGHNVHIAAGALVVDKDVPDDTIVFGRVPDLVYKRNTVDNNTFYFD